MEKQNIWNEALKYGAFIGAILALSYLLESKLSLSGNMNLYVLLMVEYIAVVVLHYYLLHRFTRQRSAAFSAEEGFTFGQGYGYVLLLSGVAGIIVGLVQSLYLHLFLGYESYIERYIASISGLIAQQGDIPSSMGPFFSQLMTQIQNSPEPSFISSVIGGFFSVLLFGGIFGLIIAGVISRQPKLFDTDVNE